MKQLSHIYGLVIFLALLGSIFLLAHPIFAESASGITGNAATGVQIVVPTHDIARGTRVHPGDFTTRTVAAGTVQPSMLQSVGAVTGQVSRRTLYAGKPLRRGDFKLEQLVKRGAIVTMSYNVPGIHLTASMRAIKAGGMGETIIVQNPTSFKQVGAIVTGPGKVEAISAHPVTQLSRAGQ